MWSFWKSMQREEEWNSSSNRSITLARVASMEEIDFVEAGIQPSGSQREILISILSDTGAQIAAIPADMHRNEISETKLFPRGTNAITVIGSPIISRGTSKATIRWPTDNSSNSKSIDTTFHSCRIYLCSFRLAGSKATSTFKENSKRTWNVTSWLSS